MVHNKIFIRLFNIVAFKIVFNGLFDVPTGALSSKSFFYYKIQTDFQCHVNPADDENQVGYNII